MRFIRYAPKAGEKLIFWNIGIVVADAFLLRNMLSGGLSIRTAIIVAALVLVIAETVLIVCAVKLTSGVPNDVADAVYRHCAQHILIEREQQLYNQAAKRRKVRRASDLASFSIVMNMAAAYMDTGDFIEAERILRGLDEWKYSRSYAGYRQAPKLSLAYMYIMRGEEGDIAKAHELMNGIATHIGGMDSQADVQDTLDALYKLESGRFHGEDETLSGALMSIFGNKGGNFSRMLRTGLCMDDDREHTDIDGDSEESQDQAQTAQQNHARSGNILKHLRYCADALEGREQEKAIEYLLGYAEDEVNVRLSMMLSYVLARTFRSRGEEDNERVQLERIYTTFVEYRGSDESDAFYIFREIKNGTNRRNQQKCDISTAEILCLYMNYQKKCQNDLL